MASQAEIGLIGLGVMGQNLALNIADHGFEIAVYNRTAARTEAFAASDEASARPIVPCSTLEDLVGALRTPRAIILMVQAGAATDEQIEALAPLLEPGDVIVDGGNARYQDTIRREGALRERGLRFLGTGISGGEEGARHGPSIMAGGDAEAYARVQPVLEAIAAQVDGAPCCAHLGPDGAGHFVKMIHNGIEYADMQLIAETYALMKDGLGLDYAQMQAAFAAWNEGDLELLSDRDHRRHSGQARSGDRGADGRGDPRSRRAEGHRRLGGGRGARSRGAGADHRRGGRRPLALGGEGRAGARRDAAERAGSFSTTPLRPSRSRPCAMRFSPPRSPPMPRALPSWRRPAASTAGA